MNKMNEQNQVHYYKLPLKYLSLKISSFSDICTTKSFNVFVKFCTFLLLTFLFQNIRVWPLKTLKKLLMAGNSSRIPEKIQINFEINFVPLTDSINFFEFVFFFMLLGSNTNYYMQLKSNL